MSQQPPSLGRTASAAEGDLRLPRAPGVIRRFWTRHPWWADSLITAAYGIALIASSAAAGGGESAYSWLFGLILALISAAAVLFRRHVPLLSISVAIICCTLAISFREGIPAIAVCLLLYAVAVYHSNRAAWIALACAVAASIAGTLVGSMFPVPAGIRLDASGQPVATYAIFMLIAVLIGVNIGNRKRYIEALLDRAAQLARERDQQAQLATAAERARIAREMHDIVSHSLTVMVTLADGSAALTASAPDRAETAMRQVAETGRQALTDMRRMLGVLDQDGHDEDGAFTPQPGTDNIAALIETFRGAGLPVRSSVTGIAPSDPGRQLAVFRVVQESLTNALRYAPDATRVVVDIRYRSQTVTITVSDDGHGILAPGRGAGRGLLGIGERVALYGGTVSSGPRNGGGWQVRATFDAGEGNDA